MIQLIWVCDKNVGEFGRKRSLCPPLAGDNWVTDKFVAHPAHIAFKSLKRRVQRKRENYLYK